MTTTLRQASSPLAHSSNPRTPTRQRQYKGRDFSSPTTENPRKIFLRDRFKQRCAEAAQKSRDSEIKRKRWTTSNGPSSDGFDCDMDEDEEQDESQDAVLNDELFRRIMASAKHKAQYKFRVSYQLDVGSSFDPDMEDIDRWEHELQENSPLEDQVPDEYDDDELAAYAEECALQEDLEAFADDIFTLSDFDDPPEDIHLPKQKGLDGDVDMC